MTAAFFTGYARTLVIVVGHLLKDDSPAITTLLYIVFASLDGIDGWAARKLNQCSSFGAWVIFITILK